MLGAALLLACGPDDSPDAPRASADDIAHAEELYTRCVEDELGLEIASLEIEPDGEVVVEFGDGSTEQDAQRAAAICEARIAPGFEPGGIAVLGPPPNLGQPGSDQDLQRLLNARVGLGFEGAVLIEADGVRRVDSGYGALSADDTREPNADTAFDCGSIMKDVTAAAIFLLEEDGVLSRERTVGELIAEAPDVWRSVTIDQLLGHEAGFHPYHDTEGDFEQMDRDTALQRILAQEPLFEPGSDSAYSNSGYTLLAIVIEEVTQQAYRDFVRERIFEPLGMERSGSYADGRWQDGNVARGSGAAVHEGNDPSAWPAPSWALIGNGGLVSTLADLLRLARAFDGEGLFQDDTRQAFREFAEQQSGASIGGEPVFGAAGGNDFGFNAFIAQVPSDGVYVLAASHVLLPINAEILGVELLQVLYGAQPGVAETALR